MSANERSFLFVELYLLSSSVFPYTVTNFFWYQLPTNLTSGIGGGLGEYSVQDYTVKRILWNFIMQRILRSHLKLQSAICDGKGNMIKNGYRTRINCSC